ncbi:class GN sortase [Shewanella sp. 10N.286.48.B5]|uniref:class GN sortase n=1 Tax=Shewanella sp. 10N.286.48.B5 TaxID=1880834 RepID=UPI000C819063|nr:class GN sortase [Shewanella sp. 10N.286.48.B5]PMH85870.1 sortase, marine proteobacterial type [Shewanella sp. 10N.286.48.B5]
MLIPGCLAVLGVSFLSHGAYMQVKANFAQYLIEQAWNKTLQDQTPYKPWSWADTHPVGKLMLYADKETDVYPVGDPMFVLAGASGRNLAFGPSLMLKGAGVGEVGNTIIAGHRDTHFSHLKNVKKGDIVELETAIGQIQSYLITGIDIVHETQTEILDMTADNQLTLITCYPFEDLSASSDYRYVVTAKQVNHS